MSRPYTVRAQDVAGELRYSWEAALLAREAEEDLVVLAGDWERPLHHAGREEAAPVTNRSLEFYWLGRLYAVFALFDRDWGLREYYGRVIRPPKLDERHGLLTLVLLGPDLQVRPDLDYRVLERADRSRLSPDEERTAERALLSLVELVERREGPFDSEFLGRFLERVRRGS